METEKLYELDSHCRNFTARVLACTPGKHGYDVILDRTAFFPEGGGQPGDQGWLDDVAVTDVHTAGGEIVHFCKAPLPVGQTVSGGLNYGRRHSLMQQHSGEHIVSGLVFRQFGFHNVGFHMGHDAVTIDFDGFLSEDQLQAIEAEANRVVWDDLPVRTFYPDPETLASLPYRSKKAIDGAVRLVEFPGVDLCACCGTHVQHTGEIGLIKLLSSQKFHEGVRIELLCGAPAFSLLARVWRQNKTVAGLFSAKPLETAAAAGRVAQELEAVKARAARLEETVFAQRAEALRGTGDVLLFEEPMRPDAIRRLADAVQKTCGGRAAVFSPDGEGGFGYAIAQPGGNLRDFTKALNQALQGRGGGKPEFVQGSVRADRAAVEAFFREAAL